MDQYLYEIIDEYQYADTEEEKNDIFRSFCSLVWSSGNKKRTCPKTIRFSVRKDLLHTEIGQIFAAWSKITYTGYRPVTKETDWRSLIRQKINNLYTKYFDQSVVLDRGYLNLLKTPKRLYFQWIGGADMEPGELTAVIRSALDDAEKLKTACQKQKMELTWNGYKKLTERLFRKIFANCKSIDDYEGSIPLCDLISEDHFYIRYFCRYLDAEMRQWQKKYYGVNAHRQHMRCRRCGALTERTGNKRMYCPECAKISESANAVMRKRRQRKRENVTK